MHDRGVFNLGFIMFFHPVAVGGFILIIVGWIVLLGGGASRYGIGSDAIVNFHTLWIAIAIIMTGCALMIGGVVAGAATSIRQALLFHPAIKEGDEAFQRALNIESKEEYDWSGHPIESDAPAGPEEEMQRRLREKGLS